MPKATLKHKNEKFESLLRRFNRAVEKDGTLLEYKSRQEFVKPSMKKRLERVRAIKREERRFKESANRGFESPSDDK